MTPSLLSDPKASYRLRRAERDRHLLRLTLAEDREHDLVARFVGLDRFDQRVAGFDRLAVDGDDQVGIVAVLLLTGLDERPAANLLA